jgi:hypothetical protein
MGDCLCLLGNKPKRFFGYWMLTTFYLIDRPAYLMQWVAIRSGRSLRCREIEQSENSVAISRVKCG